MAPAAAYAIGVLGSVAAGLGAVPANGGEVMPPVVVFGLTWLLGMLLATIWLTR